MPGGHGRALIATDRALYRRATASGGWSRVGWEEIDRVDHVDGSLELIDIDDHRRASIHDVEQKLISLVEERVQWTKVSSVQLRPSPSVSATLIARRRAGDGEVTWRVVVDEGVDPDDPVLRAAIRRAMPNLREEVGMAPNSDSR